MNTNTIIRFCLPLAALLGLAVAPADAQLYTVATTSGGLTVTVDGTNYTAPAAFAWVAGSLHSLNVPSPQLSINGFTQFVFAAWSGGGSQSNNITMPASDTTNTASFTTQYLLDTAATPTGAGVITNNPSGTWYNAGQMVTLTGVTNTSYRVGYWQGVDTYTNNHAQVTMNGSRLVLARYIPADFPYIVMVVTNGGPVAPGDLIGNIDGRTAAGTKLYYVVLDNTGSNILSAQKTNALYRFVTPEGLDASTGTNAAGTNGWVLKDETFKTVASVTTLGYPIDNHDMKLLPNGHALVFGEEVRTMNMSALVTGGKTAAAVTGNVLQEIDSSNHLVFEWHTFDYIPITNSFYNSLTSQAIDYAHMNAVNIDPTDNNLLVSLRNVCEIVKINRQTGAVMWILGGQGNQFTYFGENPTNAPYYTVGQHDIHRLANGDVLFFDNGNDQGGGTTPDDRTYSRAVEYQLNETNLTATLAWQFRHNPDIEAPCTGDVKRFSNGNTQIGWGCAVPTSGYIVTEVAPTGSVVFEVQQLVAPGSSPLLLGNGLDKQVWNSPDLIRTDTYQGIVSGQTYDTTNAGVSVTIDNVTGAATNALVVQRYLDAVRYAQFPGAAPQVVMEHVILTGSNIVSLTAELDMELPDTSYVFDTPMIPDPTQVVVYQRATPGQGVFTALPTTYDPDTQTVQVTVTQTGEFIFAYSDTPQIPFTPTILGPTNQSQVNEAAPVTLTWEPHGLVGSFNLQVATDAGFANLVLNTNNLFSGSCVVQNLSTNTQYFWRVSTVNQGGTSAWTPASSFTTVAQFLQVTSPAGGEIWERFQQVPITWLGNVTANVDLDLYLNGVLNRTFATTVATTPSGGSYTWTVGLNAAILPATNYTVVVRTITGPALSSPPSQPFSIISNLTTIVTKPAGLTITADGTNYTAPVAFNWLPASTHTLAAPSPQVATNGQSASVFAAWSDNGAQSHSMVVPSSSMTNTAAFATNYLLNVTVTPPVAGTVNENIPGPWYSIGQQVSLTANPNSGYLFFNWQGVGSQTGNTAQVTINGYDAVQALFIPVSGVPIINASSFALLPDGQMQFNLTAGAGLATSATVWGATTLSAPDWQLLVTVPLTNGSGVFTDAAATNYPVRFYRLSLP